MAVDSVSGASTVASAMASSRATIADNFDTFLGLLTTQLKNQNPLDPLDTNQFTQQLVQFTSVEQQLKTNEFLEALILSNQNASNSESVNYIGKTVSATGAATDLTNGQAVWAFDADAYAEDATITIRNASGATVFTRKGPISQGEGSFVWDGVDNAGNQLADGKYSITIDAKNANGGYVGVSTELVGRVDGVDLEGGEPVLIVGSSRISLSDVTGVYQ